jgi:hypothetical protein
MRQTGSLDSYPNDSRHSLIKFREVARDSDKDLQTTTQCLQSSTGECGLPLARVTPATDSTVTHAVRRRECHDAT